jgi:hypothetical protein
MEFIKPKLKYVTTVDFGRVTYNDGFFDLLKKKKLNIVEDRLIKREWFKGEYRLIISSPGNGKAVESSLKHVPGIRPAFLKAVPTIKAERKSKII